MWKEGVTGFLEETRHVCWTGEFDLSIMLYFSEQIVSHTESVGRVVFVASAAGFIMKFLFSFVEGLQCSFEPI